MKWIVNKVERRDNAMPALTVSITCYMLAGLPRTDLVVDNPCTGQGD